MDINGNVFNKLRYNVIIDSAKASKERISVNVWTNAAAAANAIFSNSEVYSCKNPVNSQCVNIPRVHSFYNENHVLRRNNAVVIQTPHERNISSINPSEGMIGLNHSYHNLQCTSTPEIANLNTISQIHSNPKNNWKAVIDKTKKEAYDNIMYNTKVKDIDGTTDVLIGTLKTRAEQGGSMLENIAAGINENFYKTVVETYQTTTPPDYFIPWESNQNNGHSIYCEGDMLGPEEEQITTLQATLKKYMNNKAASHSIYGTTLTSAARNLLNIVKSDNIWIQYIDEIKRKLKLYSDKWPKNTNEINLIKNDNECIFIKNIIINKNEDPITNCCECGGGNIIDSNRKQVPFISKQLDIHSSYKIKNTTNVTNNKLSESQSNYDYITNDKIQLKTFNTLENEKKTLIVTQVDYNNSDFTKITPHIIIKKSTYDPDKDYFSNYVCSLIPGENSGGVYKNPIRVRDDINNDNKYDDSKEQNCNPIWTSQEGETPANCIGDCSNMIGIGNNDNQAYKNVNNCGDLDLKTDLSEQKHKYFKIDIKGIDWSRYKTITRSFIDYFKELEEYKKGLTCINKTDNTIKNNISIEDKGFIDLSNYNVNKFKIAKFRVFNNFNISDTNNEGEEINIIVWNTKIDNPSSPNIYEDLLARFDPYDRTIINWPDIDIENIENKVKLLILDVPLNEIVYEMDNKDKIIAQYKCVKTDDDLKTLITDTTTKSIIQDKLEESSEENELSLIQQLNNEKNNINYIKTNLTLQKIILNSIILFNLDATIPTQDTPIDSNVDIKFKPLVTKDKAMCSAGEDGEDCILTGGTSTGNTIYQKFSIIKDPENNIDFGTTGRNYINIYNKSIHYDTSVKKQILFNEDDNNKIKLLEIFGKRGWKTSYDSIYSKSIFELNVTDTFYTYKSLNIPSALPVSWVHSNYIYNKHNCWTNTSIPPVNLIDYYFNKLEDSYKNFADWKFEEVELIGNDISTSSISKVNIDKTNDIMKTTIRNSIIEHKFKEDEQYIIINKKYMRSNVIFSDYNINSVLQEDIQLSLFKLNKNINVAINNKNIRNSLITKYSTNYNYKNTLKFLYKYNLDKYIKTNYKFNTILCSKSYGIHSNNSNEFNELDINKWKFIPVDGKNETYKIINIGDNTISLHENKDIEYTIKKIYGYGGEWYIIKKGTREFLQIIKTVDNNSNIFMKLKFNILNNPNSYNETHLFGINKVENNNILEEIPDSTIRKDLEETTYSITLYFARNDDTKKYLNIEKDTTINFTYNLNPTTFNIKRHGLYKSINKYIGNIYTIKNVVIKLQIITQYIPFYSSNYDTFIIRNYNNPSQILSFIDTKPVWIERDELEIKDAESKTLMENSLWIFEKK